MRNEFISVEEEALKTFADKRKADEIEKELHQFITYTLGAEAWAQLIEIRGQVRKQRQEQAAAALKQKRKIIDGILIAAAVIFSGFAIYWMGYIVINKGF
jgi:serine acetyltransferase